MEPQSPSRAAIGFWDHPSSGIFSFVSYLPILSFRTKWCGVNTGPICQTGVAGFIPVPLANWWWWNLCFTDGLSPNKNISFRRGKRQNWRVYLNSVSATHHRRQDTVEEKWQACDWNLLSLELQIKTKPCSCHLGKKIRECCQHSCLGNVKVIAWGLLGEVRFVLDGLKGRGMRDFIKLQQSFGAVLPPLVLMLHDKECAGCWSE